MRKFKVGLYFNNFGISGIDISRPEKGNPGIGGTLFNFITLPYYFDLEFPHEVEWYMIGEDTNKLPEHITPIHISGHRELESVFSEYQFDIFIWKPANTKHIIPLLEKYNIKGIAWCNNIPGPFELERIAHSQMVKRAVFAGHEALDTVRDHPVINKSSVIFNGFDPAPYFQSPKEELDSNLVVFLGSLHPAKCFHLMAEAWPLILKKRPEAKLIVIGSGKLYDRKIELGPFGLAEKSYEEKFTRPLLNNDGEIMESVTFAGLLGPEKIPIMKKACVGVINPHGKSEVCPGSAIEFQACGTAVVAGARYGNLDVIQNNQTGYLVKNRKQLVNKVSYLLANPKQSEFMGNKGKCFISDKFSQQKIVSQWRSCLNETMQDEPVKLVPCKPNWLYNLKVGFEILRIVKFKFGVFKNLPSVYEYIEKKKVNDT